MSTDLERSKAMSPPEQYPGDTVDISGTADDSDDIEWEVAYTALEIKPIPIPQKIKGGWEGNAIAENLVSVATPILHAAGKQPPVHVKGGHGESGKVYFPGATSITPPKKHTVKGITVTVLSTNQ